MKPEEQARVLIDAQLNAAGWVIQSYKDADLFATDGVVPQDPNDEPASVLLERIQAEKVAAGASAVRATGKRGRKPKSVTQVALLGPSDH